MRIDLQPVSTPRLELTLPGPDGALRMVVLEQLSELGGAVERSGERVRLESVELRECVVAELQWPGDAARVAITTPATLVGVAVDGKLDLGQSGDHSGAPVSGTAAIERIDSDNLSLEIAGTRVSCDLRAENLAAEVAGDGHDQAPDIRARVLSLPGVRLRAENLAIDAAGIELEGGAELAGHELRIDEATIEQITVSLSNLGGSDDDATGASDATDTATDTASTSQASAAPSAAASAAAGRDPGQRTDRRRLSPWLDLHVFDRLAGKLHLDVTVDAKVPVIGRRRGTHKFRLPIDRGVFDYRKLERGLSLLEDALLDFKVRDGHLVLRRNIPVIGLKKDLVRWPLNEQELTLATEQRLIRLRTLPRFALARNPGEDRAKNNDTGKSPEKEKDKGKGFRLDSVKIVNIDIELAAPADDSDIEASSTSAISDLTLSRLNIQGALRYPEKTPQTLSIDARSLAAEIRELRLGGVRIVRGRIAIERLADARLVFEGMRPRSLTLSLRGVRIRDAVLAFNRQSDSPHP